MSIQSIKTFQSDLEEKHRRESRTEASAQVDPGHDKYREVNQEKIQLAVRMILEAVGEDPDREGLRDTPDRVARMYAEVFAGLRQNPADVLSARFEVGESELVLVRDIPFYSMCEHHLVPFYGKAHIAYVPRDGVVTGLSKLARLLEVYARRPQVQERLTVEVADTLYRELNAHGVFVMLQATHMCMSMRGVQKPGSSTLTKATRGNLTKEQQHEILTMLQSSNMS